MEKILVVDGPVVKGDPAQWVQRFKTFKDKVTTHAGITSITGSGTVPGKGSNWQALVRNQHDPGEVNIEAGITYVGFDFFTTYDFDFLAGRSFNDEVMSDQHSVVMNEAAAQALGYAEPDKALQQKLIVAGGDTLTIIGVLKNYHWSTLKDGFRPYLFVPAAQAHRYFSCTIQMASLGTCIDYLHEVFTDLFPESPYSYFLLEDEFNQQYQSYLQFGKLFGAFSLVAIFISCLGLFSLISYAANVRTREIGIRKVLGAGLRDVIRLLSKEYLLLWAVASVLSIPVMLYASRQWLDTFAFRTDFGVGMILLSALVLVVVALVSIGYRLYLSARVNPAASLRKP